MTRRSAPVATERQEQAALFAWLDRVAPPGLFYTAIPGGDGRATRTPGFRSGTPDVLLIYRGKPILIELKRRKGGRLSDHQSEAHYAITHAGGLAVVSYGWDEARQFLEQIIPMRGAD